MVGEAVTRRTVLGLLGASALVHAAGCGNSSTSQPGTNHAEPLHYVSLGEIARRIAARDVSPVDLTERMLDRIVAVDRSLKSYATVMRDEALATARGAEQEIRAGRYRGPLHGVPVAVKDLCYTKDVRTMGGTTVREDFVLDVDATVVSRLREAGAVRHSRI
jgi:amidase